MVKSSVFLAIAFCLIISSYANVVRPYVKKGITTTLPPPITTTNSTVSTTAESDYDYHEDDTELHTFLYDGFRKLIHKMIKEKHLTCENYDKFCKAPGRTIDDSELCHNLLHSFLCDKVESDEVIAKFVN